jgi:hypothetical protein
MDSSIFKKLLDDGKSENKNVDLSKVELDKNKLISEASLKVIAKMGLSFKTIAQEFKKIGKGFSDLVKLEGGKPSEPSNLGKDIADARANQQLFVRIPKKETESNEQKEEGFSFKKFTDLLFNLLLITVGSTIIAVSDIGTFISNIFSKVKTNAIQFKDFLIEYDWHEAFKNGSIEFLNLVSFGLVSREKAGEVFDTLGSATKRIIEGIANFLSEAKTVLVEETVSIKDWLALDVFGIDVYEVQTRGNRKERDEYIEKLKDDSLKLDGEINELSVKKDSLIKRRNIWKEKIRNLDWKEKDIDEAIYDPISGVPISGREKPISPKPVQPKPEVVRVPPPSPEPRPELVVPAIKPPTEQKTERRKDEKVPPTEGTVTPSPKVDVATSNQFEPTNNITLGKVESKTGKAAYINSKLVPRFQALVDWFESFGYQIRSLGGYNQRKIAGTDKWSTHSYGVAIDINPDKNPMVPSTTPNWTDMPIKETSATAKALGLGWGGDWRNKKDAMHFSIASNEGGDTPTKVIESAGLPIVSKSDGTQIAKNSSEIGKKQREQERKNNPVVLNVTSVNNLQVQTN